MRRTSIMLPKQLWETAKIQSVKEGRNFQELVAEALEKYLRGVAKKGGRNGG